MPGKRDSFKQKLREISAKVAVETVNFTANYEPRHPINIDLLEFFGSLDCDTSVILKALSISVRELTNETIDDPDDAQYIKIADAIDKVAKYVKAIEKEME